MFLLKDLDIKDKALFDKYFLMYKPTISEFNFTNLFCWRRYYKLKYTIIRDYICLFSFANESEPYVFLPIGDLDNINELRNVLYEIKEYFSDNNYRFVIKNVCENYLENVMGILGENFEYDSDRNDSDYVYLRSNLANLKGKKYHRKKNHVNKFMSNYDYKYIPIDENNKLVCMDILQKWLKSKNDAIDKYQYEIDAIKELIENFEILDCIGAIIEVDGKPQAFTFGERLNDDTAVIHIEKVNKEIDGLGEFINYKFCKENFDDLIYVNREEDMGIEGLRKAKKSYLPDKLMKKYTIRLVDNAMDLIFA